MHNSIPLLILSALAGFAHAQAMAFSAEGWALPWLQWLSMVALSGLVAHNGSLKHGVLVTLIFSYCNQISALYWIYISLHTFGGLSPSLAILSVLVLALVLSWYLPALFYLFWLIQKKTSWPIIVLSWASIIGLSELAKGQWFGGLPFAISGYAHSNSGLTWLMPWLGVYGVGFIIAAMSMSIWYLPKHAHKFLATLTLTTFISLPILPASQSTPGESISVELLQGNFSPILKFNEDKNKTIRWYIDRIQQSKSEVVLTPETAMSAMNANELGELQKYLQKDLSATQAVWLGVLDLQGSSAKNSVLALTQQKIYQYSKTHLVPFGEFIPNYFRWFVNMLNLPFSDLQAGIAQPPHWYWKNTYWLATICFEDLFGEEMASRMVLAPYPPNILVNISNLTWFDPSSSSLQHLNISRERTLELDRPMLSIGNSGITAIIDHQGKIVASIPARQREVLLGEVTARSGPLTFYSQWAGRWGLLPLWLLFILLLTLALVPWKTLRANQSPS
ncbi:MAG: apolipoprotein N-acyltransferase [Gammaproteobacteria bacterium]|nr:apolipoprotein N-acyltransferase [Gammaproteobacteria bacterium]